MANPVMLVQVDSNIHEVIQTIKKNIMAKPILVIHVNPEDANNETLTSLRNWIKKSLDNEYHVLIISHPTVVGFKLECFNDCEGLPDVDIEALVSYLKK